MVVYKTFKTELDTNNTQRTKLAQHAGCARFAYNWGLGLIKESYDRQKEDEHRYFGRATPTKEELRQYRKENSHNYIQPSAITLHKLLVKKKNDELPWLNESSKWSPQNALRNLENAFKRFFTGVGCFPRFKKKGGHDSFTLNEPIAVFRNKVKLPKIGEIRLKEHGYIPVGNPKSATLSKQAGHWFVSVRYEVEIKQGIYNEETLGIDLGIKSLATCSDGTEIKNSDKLKKLDSKLKRTQRKFSKQVKGSNSKERTKSKLQSIHLRISNSRKDILHKATTLLVKTKPEGVLAIEDLNVSGMMKNHKLAKSIGNVGMSEFRRQLEYKSAWYGKDIKYVDRFFPSSKMCSCCGALKNDLTLKDRVYKCSCCEIVIDRDLNASINIKNFQQVENTVSYTGINAGGDKRFIGLQRPRCLSAKPEENLNSSGFRIL